jgi:hypothetical protein
MADLLSEEAAYFVFQQSQTLIQGTVDYSLAAVHEFDASRTS